MSADREDVARMVAAVDRGARCEMCGGSRVVHFGGGASAPCIVCDSAYAAAPVRAVSVRRAEEIQAGAKRARRRFAVAVAIAAVVAVIVPMAVWATVAHARDPRGGLPACVTEDARDCYWDASEHGNGAGRSFTDRAGVVTFWEAGR
jgi:hypothetical protein